MHLYLAKLVNSHQNALTESFYSFNLKQILF